MREMLTRTTDTVTMAKKLNILLANEFVLYIKTLNFHWNVTGPHFGQLHLLFNNQYETLLDWIDKLAERIRMLDMPALATLHQFAAQTTIIETPETHKDYRAMLQELVNDHTTLIQLLYNGIDVSAELHDMGNNNFLCDLLQEHEKMLWMLHAHLVS